MKKKLDSLFCKLAENDPSFHLVVADLGSFNDFRVKYPYQYHNVGVTEQFSVLLAAGLANGGMNSFVYGVSGFTIYRAYEQIKYYVGHWNQNVTIIGTGFGWKFYNVGSGHRISDDLCLMRNVPNMRICVPACYRSLRDEILRPNQGPRFIRISENTDCDKTKLNYKIGDKITICTIGGLYSIIKRIMPELDSSPDIGLVAIEAFDCEANDCFIKSPVIVVEDHCRIGGLADYLSLKGHKIIAHKHLPNDIGGLENSDALFKERMKFDDNSIRNWLLSILERVL